MGEHLEEQANKQAGRQARKQGSRQALGVHSVRAMPWRGLFHTAEKKYFNLSEYEISFSMLDRACPD